MSLPAWPQRLLHALPGRLLRPLALLPGGVAAQGFVMLCNAFFAAALAAEELDFLDGRVLRIVADDAGLSLAIGVRDKRLYSHGQNAQADVTIAGHTYELLLLISQREDADTLFFQRRLRLQGDTELGLQVKNFLDAWEPPASVRRLQQFAAVGMDWAERVTRVEAAPLSDRPDRSNSLHRIP